MDKIDTHTLKMKKHYDSLYSKNEKYWGDDPSPLSLLLFSHLYERKNLTLLDIGCGQGPDSIYFAKKGFNVTAIDISEIGLNHLNENASKINLQNKITTIELDIQKIDELPKENFTVVFSRMALQMIPEEKREEYLEKLKEKYPDSIHVHIIPISGACFGNEFICKDNLLMKAYKDWNILFSDKVHTISRTKNKNNEPYLMKEAWMIAKSK